MNEEAHYEEALELIESLLEEALDSANEPLNAVIDMLSHAIEAYENQDQELVAFEAHAMGQPADRVNRLRWKPAGHLRNGMISS